MNATSTAEGLACADDKARLRPQGSAETVRELLEEYGPYIRRVIARRSDPGLLRQTTIDDLYHDTVAAALSSAQRFCYSDVKSFRVWINTIAWRTIRQTRKTARPSVVRIRRPCSSGAGVTEDELRSAQRTPSSVAAGTERTNSLRNAVDALPPYCRDVITLYKLEQRPLDEVAEQTGSSKSAVCKAYIRAVKILRARLPQL